MKHSVRTCLYTVMLGSSLLSVAAGHIAVNTTPSAPQGLYWYTPLVPDVPLQVGQRVLMTPPAWVQEEVHRVAPQIPTARPWLKTVVASGGDTVCLTGSEVWINGCLRAQRPLLHDYPLTQLGGCTTLQAGEYFVMGEHPRSFDGRYLGAIERQYITGVVTPFYLWESTP